MNAERTGGEVVRVTVSKDEARALGKTWHVEPDGGVSVLVSTDFARELRSALSAALNDPKEAA